MLLLLLHIRSTMALLCVATGLTLLSGCVSKPVKSSPAPSTTPVWVTQPPKDDAGTLWGIGEGVDLESAKRSALKDVAAKLRVAISAQLESRTTVSNQSVDRFARTRVSEDVQRTEFRNHSLEKSAPSPQGLYALVRVDRKAFASDSVQKLTAAEKEIQNLLQGVDALPLVERFVAYQKAQAWLEKAIATGQVLATIDSGFDQSRLVKHEATLVKAKNAASELVFEIRAGNDSQDVAQTIRGFLNDSGIKIGKGGAPLIIDSASSQDDIFNSKSVKLRVTLSILDAKGRNLTTREITANGASMSDFKSARLAALKNLGERLRSEGPVRALGFETIK